jgi:hypothetical protein
MNVTYSQMLPSSCYKCMLNPASVLYIGPMQFHHAVWEVYRRFGGTSVHFYQTIWHHIPENSNLQVSCCELSDRRIRRFSTIKTKAHDWRPCGASFIHLPSLSCISLQHFLDHNPAYSESLSSLLIQIEVLFPAETSAQAPRMGCMKPFQWKLGPE